MGARRDAIFKKCGVSFPLNMDDFQLSHGMESEKILKNYFPEVCEEVKGITDVLNIDYMIHILAADYGLLYVQPGNEYSGGSGMYCLCRQLS